MRSTPNQRQEHVRRWRASGLSKAAYCREHNLVKQTFTAWTKALSAASDGVGNEAFVHIDDDRPALSPDGCALRARMGSRDLAFSAAACPSWVAAVLERLSPC